MVSIFSRGNVGETNDKPKATRGVLVVSIAVSLFVGLVIGLLGWPFYWVATGLVTGRNIQTLESPKNMHSAQLLKKINLADINYIVKVDGRRVFVSPDLMNFPDHLYRETLVWDETGTVVVFEQMGRRIFAYNAAEKRELNKGELADYKFYPALADNYFYTTLKDLED